MDAYSEFSIVYDAFMDNIPYHEWIRRICEILHLEGIDEGIVADLGCGTGIVTEGLAAAGYDMIGIDSSMEMLEVAMDKRCESGHNSILYLQQDMREFELYGTVRAIVSVCDSISYILDEEELVSVFRLVNNYLDPDGIFIFDFTTEHKYSEIEESTIAENREEGSFIWENTYYRDEKINEYELTLFIPDEQGKYDKYTELHQQRAYSLEEMERCLKMAGMRIVNAEDNYSGNNMKYDSSRIVITAKKEK